MMVILPSFGSVSLGMRDLFDRGSRSCVCNRSTYGGAFCGGCGLPTLYLSACVSWKRPQHDVWRGPQRVTHFVVRFRPTPPCTPGRAVPTRGAGRALQPFPPTGGGGLAYISQQRPAARRRSAGREARGCSRRAEPWPVSGGARRGGARPLLPSGPRQGRPGSRLRARPEGGGRAAASPWLSRWWGASCLSAISWALEQFLTCAVAVWEVNHLRTV